MITEGEERIWTHCPVCMTREDHIWHDDKWHCERCGAYNPGIVVDFDHFMVMVHRSDLPGDNTYWERKYKLLKDKSIDGIKEEMPFLAVHAVGNALS